MDITAIKNYISDMGKVSVADLQSEFGLSYKSARDIISDLTSRGELVFDSGLNYAAAGPMRRTSEPHRREYVTRPESELDLEELRINALQLCVLREAASASLLQRELNVRYFTACNLIEWMENEGYVSQYEGNGKPRKVLISSVEFDKKFRAPDCVIEEDDDDDDDDPFFDKQFAEYERYLKEHLEIDDGEDDDKADGDKSPLFKTDAVDPDIFLSECGENPKLSVKVYPISRRSDGTPIHPDWDNEDEFATAVTERIRWLIKSDIKMGKQGAEKKAEACLEAVRETGDARTVQLYEQLLFEMKNTSNYLYAQLKKQIFEGE